MVISMAQTVPTWRQLHRAILRYARARIRDSWKGGQMPEEWPEIDEELAEARTELHNMLRRLPLSDE